MKLIVGLGNAGRKYDGTRHNLGFEVIDELAKRWNVDMSGEKFSSWFGLGDFRGERVALMKPLTLMNRSGKAVAAAGRFYKLELSDLLVVLDDHALPVGRLRIRSSGSAGGHNGLDDVIRLCGGDQFARLRIGIGEVFGAMSVYVLSRFTKEERENIDFAIPAAADACECWVIEGTDLAMTKFNGDPPGVER